MILLNEPWSIYERYLDHERRQQAARRAILCLLYCASCVAIGILIGVIMAG